MSAAHPNQEELTGYKLIAWFETCLKEVITKDPAGPVLEVGRLLANLRGKTLQATDAPAIVDSIKKLPENLVAALLRSIVGLYCDPKQDVRVRDNIKLIAKSVWTCASEQARGEVGLRHANHAANGDVDRKKDVHTFLTIVGGLPYLSEAELALEIHEKVMNLESAHEGYDNFYNEVPIAKQLRRYVPTTGKMPAQVIDEYVRVLVRCRIGRKQGVATAAEPHYDALIDLFEEPQIKSFFSAITSFGIAPRLELPANENRFRAILAKLKKKAVGAPMQRIFQFVEGSNASQLVGLGQDQAYKRLLGQL